MIILFFQESIFCKHFLIEAAKAHAELCHVAREINEMFTLSIVRFNDIHI